MEVYTDGFMRYFDSVITSVLQQPKSPRRPIHAQGGILVNFDNTTALTDHKNNIKIIVEVGTLLPLTFSTFTEIHSILLAIELIIPSQIKELSTQTM